MIQGDSMRASTREPDPAMVIAAFTEAFENIRHIRGERIWFCNAYGKAVV